MIARLIGAVVLVELLVAAPIAIWLMWRYAFRSIAAYHTGNALIGITFATPIVVAVLFYVWSRNRNAQD